MITEPQTRTSSDGAPPAPKMRMNHSSTLFSTAERVTEIITRIRIALPTAYPYQLGFAMLAGQIGKLPP